MIAELEELLSHFRRHNPCCKTVMVKLETVVIGAEMNCLTAIAGFFTSHDLLARRTPNGLEFSVDDLSKVVEIYRQPAG